MRNKKEPVITQEEWLKELFPFDTVIPTGALSVEDVMKATELSRAAVSVRMRKGVADGTIEEFKVLNGGKLRNFYRKKHHVRDPLIPR